MLLNLIFINFYTFLRAREYPDFISSNKDKESIQIIKKADLTTLNVKSTVYLSSLVGIGALVMMSLLTALFIYQRRRAKNRPYLNPDFIGKKEIISNGGTKEFIANGGILNDESSFDKRLAQTANLYQYQHQKQQMLSLQRQMSVLKDNDEEGDSGDENEGGEDPDYTVYECPGLASASEMEVKNPLFNDSALNTSAGSSRED